jgi:hypothetical protein
MMKKRYRRVYITQYSLLVLTLVVVVGLVLAGLVILEHLSYEDHFAISWAAGRAWLLEGEDPYGAIIGDEAYTALFKASFNARLPETHSFTDPIFNLFFFLPFSLLPFKLSRAVWFAVSVITMGLIGYFSLKLAGWKVTLLEKVLIIGLFILSFVGVESIISGHLTPLIVLLILAGLDALIHGRDTLAGFLFSLTFGALTTSALIVLFVLIWSISRRRWAVLKAYFAGLGFLWAISLLLIPSWPSGWFRANLPLIESWDWIQTPLMDLSLVLPGIAQPMSLALHAIFAVILLTVLFTTLNKTGLVFTWNTLAILVLAYLFHIESSVFSLYLVFPAFFMVLRFSSDRWRVVGRVLSWVILIGLAAGTWLYARPDFSLNMSQRFPILIAGLPLLILAGMVTVRWWAIRIPRLPYEPA